MLYFVATPIGNLKDISYRAIETLKSVDVIACEDTRNSLKLLLHYDIKKQLISHHKFNEKNSTDGIIKLLKEGKNIAVISDCGMPIISDPGSVLVKRLIEEGLDYTVVPGANAGLSALLLSGFDATKFTFVGFLSDKNTDRKKQLLDVAQTTGSIIFYISPHSLKKDTQTIFECLGKRKACLIKEITKIHETKIYFDLGEDFDCEEKGEFVLVVEGYVKQIEDNLSIEEQLKNAINQGIPKSDAIKLVAKNNNLPKSDVYKYTINKI